MKGRQPKIKEITSAKNGTTYRSFQVYWTDDSGKFQRKQFSDRQSASIFAAATHTALLGKESAHSIRSTVLTLDQLRDAEQAFSRIAPKYSLEEVVDHFFKTHHTQDFEISLTEAFTRWLEAIRGSVRDRSIVQFSSTLRQFRNFVGEKPVHLVTTDDVENFLISLRDRNGVGPASRKTWMNCRGFIAQFFNWAKDRRQSYVKINPCDDVRKFKIDKGDIEVLTLEQSERLMRTAETFKDGKMIPYFSLALFAGIRPGGELEKINRDQINNGVIRILANDAKTRDTRQVQVRPNLQAWLDKFRGDICPPGYAHDMIAIRKVCGMDNAAGRDVCRHTFISNHIATYKSFADAAIEAGNSETIIRKHYFNRVSPGDSLKFWQIVPKE
jgi:hypothetical protein